MIKDEWHGTGIGVALATGWVLWGNSSLRWYWIVACMLVAWFITFRFMGWRWARTPEGRVAVAEYERQQAEAAELARQEQSEALRGPIICEYRERSGNPYAEVPEGYIVFRWNEMEKEAAADARTVAVMQQQKELAWRQIAFDLANTSRIANSITPFDHYATGTYRPRPQ